MDWPLPSIMPPDITCPSEVVIMLVCSSSRLIRRPRLPFFSSRCESGVATRSCRTEASMPACRLIPFRGANDHITAEDSRAAQPQPSQPKRHRYNRWCVVGRPAGHRYTDRGVRQLPRELNVHLMCSPCFAHVDTSCRSCCREHWS